ncbi:LAMI_0B04610g1_1 [Lachancea mirantina]|uniref:Regulator of rDNA transcription protein 5 n=1 Tax=Lachancea mirantina TaxID=1230905 RepID=A0A1G4IVK9_9SACH|nr:LAMI_0B04610g1_1 [Lachancea mirantina]
MTAAAESGSDPASTSIPSKRVYISNLSFNATEEELRELLANFKLVSVLIPSQTVRGFRSSSVRPLGIGYADFASAEEAGKAIEELNGIQFKDRTLRLKPYVPYSPRAPNKKPQKSKVGGSKLKKNSSKILEHESCNEGECLVAEPPSALVPAGTSVFEQEHPEPLSEDTVYCAYLPSNVTDIDLREFFKDYKPQDIYVFRNSGSRRGLYFHRRFTAALVTLGKPEALKDCIEQLSKTKSLGKKKIILRPARLSKIQEVQQAAARKLAAERAKTELELLEAETTRVEIPATEQV